MEKVSVLIATYNGGRFLREQLESVLGQTYTNLEILVRDDQSTDNTYSILEEFSARDPRVVVKRNNENLGINRNFLTLVHEASGEYIAICDQDDVWEENKIAVLVSEIGENSMIYCDSAIIDSKGDPEGYTFLEKINKTAKCGQACYEIAWNSSVPGHATLFHRDLIEFLPRERALFLYCLLYTSDAADD